MIQRTTEPVRKPSASPADIDPSLAELARFLSEEFLPEQQDGGIWKGKKSCVIAIHYLKKQAKEIEELQAEIRSREDDYDY